jgi:hypothetical protein
MPAELLVTSGIVVGVLLAFLAARSGSANRTAADEITLAKRYIDAEIDGHIAPLAARYGEVAMASGHDDPDRFRLEVELFIAQVLERHLDDPEAAELRDAVREVLVLEREYVFERVLARIRAYRADG